jgi:hypothetical protein
VEKQLEQKVQPKIQQPNKNQPLPQKTRQQVKVWPQNQTSLEGLDTKLKKIEKDRYERTRDEKVNKH